MSYSNLVFSVIFVAEAALKLAAFGPAGYFRDGWNCFDFLVAAASVASVALDFSNTRDLSFMPMLRALRVVRVVRLVRHVGTDPISDPSTVSTISPNRPAFPAVPFHPPKAQP